MGDDLRDVVILHQSVPDRRAVLRSHQHVEIADRVAAPAIAAGDNHAPAIAEKGNQRIGLGLRYRDLESPCGLRLFERTKQFLFDHGAESAKLAQPPGFDGLPEIVEGAYLQFVIEQLDTLGSQSGKSGHVAKLAGKFPLQRVEQS